jgi:UDP-N-acetylmuramoyl-tripeptide--D-alanyl-D-alanine ligase
MEWRLTEILAATGGKAEQQGQRQRFNAVVTDSKQVTANSIFVALKGERHDGHEFIADAVKRGAACVVVQRRLAPWVYGKATVVRVGDTLRALGDLAHFQREKLAPKVLAITGSNGKTTTKEMTAAILEEATIGGHELRGRVLKTEGNFNNLVGLPLTLLRLTKRHRVAVVELGTNQPGEIARLAAIADPDFGIVTSVAAAHLEGLKSLTGVAKEKGALFSHVRHQGAIALNLDDRRVQRLGKNFAGKKLTYGKRGAVRAAGVRVAGGRGTLFTLQAGRERAAVRLNYLGQHNVSNALGAAALTLAAGVKLAAVRRGLSKAKPYAMRMQIESWRGAGVINDTYNANPGSMLAALKTLAAIDNRGEKIAVLGDMFELGEQSAREHRALGAAAAKAGVDRLFLLGAQAPQVRLGARRAGMAAERVVIGADHRDLAEQLKPQIKRGDWVLFKGSRGMKMENVLSQLKGVAA